MSENEPTNIESLKNSDNSNLSEELEQLKVQAEIFRQIQNYKDEAFFRMSLIQEIRALNEIMAKHTEELNSISKKVSNQNKILAAHLGVEIE